MHKVININDYVYMNKTILNSKESLLLENLIVNYGQVVSSEQIFDKATGLWDHGQTKNTIVKLRKNGWLVRIKKGLYVISDFGNRGFLSISPYLVANLLVPESYVSFWSAMQHHGMFDQLTDKTTSVSMKAYKTVKLNNMEYQFIKTQKKNYFGWQEFDIDGGKTRIATAEKALIDIVNFHRNKYSIDLVIEKIREHNKSLNFARLNKYLDNSSIATMKIFGFILDLIGIDSSGLHKRISAKKSTHWMFKDSDRFSSKWRLYYDKYFDKYLT